VNCVVFDTSHSLRNLLVIICVLITIKHTKRNCWDIEKKKSDTEDALSL
jgi:hypothetical protein